MAVDRIGPPASNVLAYIDSFVVLGFAVMEALFLMLLLRDPPAHHRQHGQLG
jgi:hypothetical protein